MNHVPVKYTAKNDPALKFWAERTGIPGSKVETYSVISQVAGFPATEAHDDWFGKLTDADEVARKLADEAPIPDAEILAIRARGQN